MGCCCSTSAAVSPIKVNARSLTAHGRGDGQLITKRYCTDKFFFFLFVVYVGFLVISVAVAGALGDPKRLIYGVDNYGNLCGVRNNKPVPTVSSSGQDKTKEKYVVMDMTCAGEDCTLRKTCQQSCPEGYREMTLKRCLPRVMRTSSGKIKYFAESWLQEIGSDVSLCWPHILLLCGISIGLSIVLMLIFRYCAAFIIWVVLIAVGIASIGLTIFLWVKWDEENKAVKQLPKDLPERDLLEKRVTYWLISAIVATIFTVVYLLILLVMRSRISLVATLFQEAGKAIGAMPLILIQPIWTFIAVAIVCAFLLVGFICLQTSGPATVDSRGYVIFPNKTFFQVARWLLLFGFLWMTQFVLACQHLVVAGAITKWYFTRDKRRLSSPILHGLGITVCYHLGSASMGSFVIALVQLIRILFKMIQRSVGEKGERCEILWKMFQCCLACFESYLKFLSRNAYIMIAMFGDGFCTSAKRAFNLLAANFMRLAALECVGDFVLFVGKVGVTVAIAFISFEVTKGTKGINYVWVPIGISCAFAFIICHCFLSIYEMAMDTLLLCFCEDCELNDGVTKPYFMSRSLMMFLEKNKRNSKIADLNRS